MEETVLGATVNRNCQGDTFAADLAEQLLTITEEYGEQLSSGEVALEVEGRLGIINDPESRQRLQIPLDSEAILSRSLASSFRWQFDAALSEETFKDIKQNIAQAVLVETQAGLPNSPTALSFYRKEVHTVDQFVRVPGYEENLRVSYGVKQKRNSSDTAPSEPDIGKGPLEIISKEKVAEWTIYTGRDKEEDDGGGSTNIGAKHGIDYRIVINLEKNHSKLIPKFEEGRRRGVKVCFQRERMRESYISKLFQIDTTSVIATGRNPYSFEIEVELNPTVLLAQIALYRSGSENQLHTLISNLLNTVRDWCSAANSNAPPTTIEDQQRSSRNGPQLTDLTKSAISNIDPYEKYISSQHPLVGDYLYRRVAKTLELCDAHRDQTYEPEDQKAFCNPLLFPAPSLYVENANSHITGPWSLLNTISDMEERGFMLPAWCEDEKVQFPQRVERYLNA